MNNKNFRKVFLSILIAALLFLNTFSLVYASSVVGGSGSWPWWPELDYDHLASDRRTAVYNARMTWNNVGADWYLGYDASDSNDVIENVGGYNGSLATCVNTVDAFGNILDSDIYMNTFFNFSTDGASGTYDYQSIMLHEMGHMAGLGHSSNSVDVMHNTAPGLGTTKRILTNSDKNMLINLYGLR